MSSLYIGPGSISGIKEGKRNSREYSRVVRRVGGYTKEWRLRGKLVTQQQQTSGEWRESLAGYHGGTQEWWG